MRPLDCNRRQFLKLGLAGSVGLALPAAGYAAVPRADVDRSLEFYNTHTNERLRTVYWTGGTYVSSALDDINFILRDFRANEVKASACARGRRRRLLSAIGLRARRCRACAHLVIYSWDGPHTF